MALECTNSNCPKPATRIMAYEATAVRCLYVAPYCDDHPGDFAKPLPATGPALSEEARELEGRT